MAPLGRMLIFLGAILLVAGLLLTHWNIFSFLRLGRLPGDIWIKRGNLSFYLPLTTCIILSLLISLIFYLFRK
jgi:hypothetical protein